MLESNSRTHCAWCDASWLVCLSACLPASLHICMPSLRRVRPPDPRLSHAQTWRVNYSNFKWLLALSFTSFVFCCSSIFSALVVIVVLLRCTLYTRCMCTPKYGNAMRIIDADRNVIRDVIILFCYLLCLFHAMIQLHFGANWFSRKKNATRLFRSFAQWTVHFCLELFVVFWF